MSKSVAIGKVLMVDDEPEYLTWVEDYFSSLGETVVRAVNVLEAFAALSKESFDVVLVDMNIPHLNAINDSMRARSQLIERYPGIAVAFHCRDLGYAARKVIVYTVHDDELVEKEFDRISCRYVLKGRPQILKSVIRKSFEPT